MKNHSDFSSFYSHLQRVQFESGFPATFSFSLYYSSPSSSSSLPVNIWCAEINKRIPSFFVARRWSTILAKDIFKCLSSHDTQCVWQNSSSSCRDIMFSEALLLYLSNFSCIFIQQLIAASFVVSCPLWVKSFLREDFWRTAVHFSWLCIMPLYIFDNININPAKGVSLHSGLIWAAFTKFIGSLT